MAETHPPYALGSPNWGNSGRAGWRTSAKLDVPGNITLVLLPATCPKLSPQENVW